MDVRMSSAVPNSRFRLLITCFLALLILLVITSMAAPQRVFAASLVVNSTGDDPDANPGDGICATAGSLCTLRAAIQTANALGGGNDISFDPTLFSAFQTITLTSEFPHITGELTITGTSDGTVNISGGGSYRIFIVDAGATLNISQLSLSDSGGNSVGGAINNGGTLTVDSTTFNNNMANVGGSIYNVGTASLTNSTIYASGTTSNGGGINNSGTLTITRSTVFLSTSGGNGGGIYNSSIVTVIGSTIRSNSAALGGGIYNNAGTLNVVNSTIGTNGAPAGGGILNTGGGTATINDSDHLGQFVARKRRSEERFRHDHPEQQHRCLQRHGRRLPEPERHRHRQSHSDQGRNLRRERRRERQLDWRSVDWDADLTRTGHAQLP